MNLLPCPFCGGAPEVSYCEPECCGAEPRMVECKCGASVYGGPDDWNKRCCIGGTAEAVSTLTKAIQVDDDFAWTWHCNIAMPMIDEGVHPIHANMGAARFMSIAFGVDVTASDQWKSWLKNLAS